MDWMLKSRLRPQFNLTQVLDFKILQIEYTRQMVIQGPYIADIKSSYITVAGVYCVQFPSVNLEGGRAVEVCRGDWK